MRRSGASAPRSAADCRRLKLTSSRAAEFERRSQQRYGIPVWGAAHAPFERANRHDAHAGTFCELVLGEPRRRAMPAKQIAESRSTEIPRKRYRHFDATSPHRLISLTVRAYVYESFCSLPCGVQR